MNSLKPCFYLEHDSVMLGEISPHHEYDSKSSTEISLSYNQLNYNENIERFFKSKPETVMFCGNDEDNANSTSSSNGEYGNGTTTSTANGSGASGSAEILSTGSVNPINFKKHAATTSGNKSRIQISLSPILTETLLSKHNEDMEKLMIQKYKEMHLSIKNSNKQKKSRIKPSEKKCVSQQRNSHKGRGVKRSRSSKNIKSNSNAKKHKPSDDRMKNIQFDGTLIVPCIPVDQNLGFIKPSNINCNENLPQTARFAELSTPVYYIPVRPIQLPIQPPMQPGDATKGTGPSHECMKNSTIYPASFISYVPGIVCTSILGQPTPVTVMHKPTPEPSSVGNNQSQSKNSNCNNNNIDITRDKNNDTSQENTSEDKSSNTETGGNSSTPSQNWKQMCPSARIQLYHNGNNNACNAPVQHSTTKEHVNVSDDCETSTSSFYSSFLNSSCSYSTNQKQKSSKSQPNIKPVRKEPPWLEGVQMTPQLIFEYQIDSKSVDEVLQSDIKMLNNTQQPVLVNNQLDQLYMDLELAGLESKLALDNNSNDSELQTDYLLEEL